jgi:serine/threonine protein kinase
MINTTIGKYKITRLIGEGGMASVYEAEHEMLGTKVAIKVLNPMLSANAQIKERFRNEAKLMASLDHPNITKVIDFDEQPQQLSIVIEYLNGEDLNQNIKRNGPLSEKEITDVFSQTLSAFQYAHEKGIVHRDIKPSNIFILPNGHVKILDFGIAKLFGQGNEMTHTGTQMGTPIYMSPEQVKADKSIDHRSDIYSLGVTLFFVINGKPPYNSDTDSQFDIFNKIVYEPLPEFSIQSKFKDIVLKACQKNREFRYQGCDDILSELNLKGIIKSEEKTIVNNTSKSHLQHDKTVLAEKELKKKMPFQIIGSPMAHPKAKKEPIGEADIFEKALLSFGVALALILIGIILFGFSG